MGGEGSWWEERGGEIRRGEERGEEKGGEGEGARRRGMEKYLKYQTFCLFD